MLYQLHMKYLLIVCLLTAQIATEIAQIENYKCATPPTCVAPKITRGCECKCDSTPCTQPYQRKDEKSCQCIFQCPEGRFYNAATNACDCVNSASNCNSSQTWNSDKCRCDCTTPLTTSCNLGQRWSDKACGCVSVCPEGKIYNTTTLACECSTAPTCQGNRVLNKDKCRCECPASPPTPCSTGYWDREACQCEIDCDEPLIQDTAGTSCVCPNSPPANGCALNRVWNTKRCYCECKPETKTCPSGDFRWSDQSCSCQCARRCQRRLQDPVTCKCI